MSTEGGGGNQKTTKRHEEAVGTTTLRQQSIEPGESSKISGQPKTLPLEATGETRAAHVASGKSIDTTSSQGIYQEDKKLAAARGEQPSRSDVVTTPGAEETKPRQVIAVSASKGPAAFFNLARKFLVTDEMCDLSALEGAIVSAVDAAHLLERSKLATIVRIQTSYVTVEPKKKRQQPQQSETPGSEQQSSSVPSHVASVSTVKGPVSINAAATVEASIGVASVPPPTNYQPQYRQKGAKGSTFGGRELRRARIVITVRRTEEYKQWLEENPLQAIIAGDGDDEVDTDAPTETALPRKPPP